MPTETAEAIKARKLTQLDALMEAIAVEKRELSRAFYHGWILSAAMELWDRGVLTREERQVIETRVHDIISQPSAMPEPAVDE